MMDGHTDNQKGWTDRQTYKAAFGEHKNKK